VGSVFYCWSYHPSIPGLDLGDIGNARASGSIIKFMTEDSTSKTTLPTVLLVEDDWVVSALIQEILEAEGFRVISFETADDAWSYLRANASLVDLIFSDIHLPGLKDGVDLANLAYQRWPNIPVILSSGGMGQQRLDPGFLPTFVSKPWHSLDIGMICRRVLERRAEDRSLSVSHELESFSDTHIIRKISRKD